MKLKKSKFIIHPGLSNWLFDGECVSHQIPSHRVPTPQAPGRLGRGAAAALRLHSLVRTQR